MWRRTPPRYRCHRVVSIPSSTLLPTSVSSRVVPAPCVNRIFSVNDRRRRFPTLDVQRSHVPPCSEDDIALVPSCRWLVPHTEGSSESVDCGVLCFTIAVRWRWSVLSRVQDKWTPPTERRVLKFFTKLTLKISTMYTLRQPAPVWSYEFSVSRESVLWFIWIVLNTGFALKILTPQKDYLNK